jgi:hypothetical protein
MCRWMVSISDELKERNILTLILIVRFVCATLDVGHPIDFKKCWLLQTFGLHLEELGLSLIELLFHLESFSIRKIWVKARNSRKSKRLTCSWMLCQSEDALADLTGWINWTKAYWCQNDSVLPVGNGEIIQCQILKKWSHGKTYRVQKILTPVAFSTNKNSFKKLLQPFIVMLPRAQWPRLLLESLLRTRSATLQKWCRSRWS